MVRRVRSQMVAGLGLAGLFLGSGACTDDAGGVTGGGESSSSSGPSVTSITTGVDITATSVATTDATSALDGTSTSSPTTTGGSTSSSSGGTSTGGTTTTGDATTGDATSTDTSAGSSDSSSSSSDGGVPGCGNGAIDPGEQCDGADLQGFDCVSLGLGGGVLACDPITCTFDTSMCMPGGGTSG
jgi:hypothetical protein